MNGKSHILLDEWLKFEKAVMPEDASDVQRREMCRAFYAGAWCLLNLMGEAADKPGDEAGVQLLENVTVECMTFVQDTLKGPNGTDLNRPFLN
jgi:hypothetical protein